MISGSFNLFSRILPLYFIAREEKFYKEGLSGSFFYTETLLHCFGVYSAVFGIKDYEQSLASHIKLLKEGKNVAIFPEGHRSKDGSLSEAKGGVVALAKAANAPIVPVAVSGILRITLKEFLLRKRFVTIRFGKPIFPEELFEGYENAVPQDYKKIATEKVMKGIEKVLMGTN